MNHFTELYNIDLAGKTDPIKKEWEDKKTGEKKSFTLNYLHWTAAIKELRTKFPSAKWKIREFNGDMPYLITSNGCMVYVSVTIFNSEFPEGDERGTWLPVMNQKHEVITDPDAFDINTAHWRCFVKACAMHGLGLKIYEGDDKTADRDASLPEMPHGAKGDLVEFTGTVQGAGYDLKGKGKKLDLVTDKGETVKLTVWNKSIAVIPAAGAKIKVSGVWEEYNDRWSIVAQEIDPGDAPASEPAPAAKTAAKVGIPDTPTNRAKVLDKYKALCVRAADAGIKPVPVDGLKGMTVDEMASVGAALSAAVEKAESEKGEQNQAPAASGKGFPI